MLRAGTVLVQHGVVQLRAVALVLGKQILGIFPVQHLRHVPVPGDLGQDGRRRNGYAASVAAYHRLMGEVDGGAPPMVPVAVDQNVVRAEGQGLDGQRHGPDPGA